MDYLVSTSLLLILMVVLFKYGIKHSTIFEYQRGLMYRKGQFKKLLQPGQYWYLPLFTRIDTLDMRPRFVSISGQEVLSQDGITLKISLAAHFEISDPVTATNSAENFQDALYLELQAALRDLISSADIDTLLQSRNEFSKKLLAMTEAKAHQLGLRLIAVHLKDLMFPGKLKEVFAQVVSARKEGLAILEKARGETAALRSLANAAKMIEANPHLIQLRLMQSLGQSSGNSVVFGLPPTPFSAVPKQAPQATPEKSAEDSPTGPTGR